MIGAIFAAYCQGRCDAMHGHEPDPIVLPGRVSGAFWRVDGAAYYRLGFRDETKRMEAERRLAQLELPLFERSERRRAPRRRATERDSSSAMLTELDIPPAR